nr:MAG TPA: hypothetical protein [Inoviridae sp.]
MIYLLSFFSLSPADCLLLAISFFSPLCFPRRSLCLFYFVSFLSILPLPSFPP